MPDDHNMPAIILETKSEAEDISNQKWIDELIKNCNIVATKYKQVVGILYNGIDVRVFKNNIEDTEAYLMFKEGIDVKEFSDKLITKVLYNSSVDSNDEGIISISLESEGNDSE